MAGCCKQCERLWREFHEALSAHLKAIGDYQTAVMRHDHTEREAFEGLTREAAHQRHRLARKALKEHQATHH